MALPEIAAPAQASPLCCSYCCAPLARARHGLVCVAEERFFATDAGIHRLLPEERRRELLPQVEMYQRMRRAEGWRATPGLPQVGDGHPHAAVWRERAPRLEQALAIAARELGLGPWRALDVGAGCCWIAARLAGTGHEVLAADVNLDPEDGLRAAERLLPAGASLERVEAEMEALPCEPRAFDLALAAASLHHAARLDRALVELHRVLRPGGLLLVLDSPVYRRRADGEAMLAEQAAQHLQRFGFTTPRQSWSGFLVKRELAGLFGGTGFALDVVGWPSPVAEAARDLVAQARHGRRTARFPILVARRRG
jgi:SAM-dependent methyltransferase